MSAVGLCPVDAVLEFSKDIAAMALAVLGGGLSGGDVRLEGKGDTGLENGGYHECPSPPAVRHVHPGSAADSWRQGGGEALAVVISSGRRVGGMRRRALGLVRRVGVGSEVSVEWLSSQEGCARLVMRNFGRVAAAEGG